MIHEWFYLNVSAGQNDECINWASNPKLIRFDGESVDKYDVESMASRCVARNGRYLVWSRSSSSHRYCSEDKPPMNVYNYGVCKSRKYHRQYIIKQIIITYLPQEKNIKPIYINNTI